MEIHPRANIGPARSNWCADWISIRRPCPPTFVIRDAIDTRTHRPIHSQPMVISASQDAIAGDADNRPVATRRRWRGRPRPDVIPQGDWPELVGRLLALRGVTDAATATTFLGTPARTARLLRAARHRHRDRSPRARRRTGESRRRLRRLRRRRRHVGRAALRGAVERSAPRRCRTSPIASARATASTSPPSSRCTRDGATLLVTADCGTSSIDEVARARELGMDVIILDHHTVPPELPDATALVNPRVSGATPGGLLELATAGLAFHVAAALHEACDRPFDADAYLDVAALGTVCDMAPLDRREPPPRARRPARDRAHAPPRPARADGGLARGPVDALRRGHRLQARPAPQRRRPHRPREARARAADDARRRARPRAGAAARRAEPRAPGAHAAGRRPGDGDGRGSRRAARADHGRPRRLLVRHRRAHRVEARQPLRPARRRLRARRDDEPRELPQHRRVPHHRRDARAARSVRALRRPSRRRGLHRRERRASTRCAST